MMRHTKRVLIITAAILFLILGVIGLVLPFLQGILFLAIGLILLSFIFPALREKTQVHTRKFPKIHTIVLKVEDYVRKLVGDI